MTKDYAKIIENALKSCLPSTDCREKKLIDAMAYSLEAGGKRVRPYLVFSFNSLCGGSEESATAFACAVEMMIKGFDAAVANMEVGQTIEVHLMPEEAYGLADPDAIFTVELAQLPAAEELEAGQQVYLQNAAGQPFPVKVVEKDETTITFDANHEMAGKELNFTIELVSVEE